MFFDEHDHNYESNFNEENSTYGNPLNGEADSQDPTLATPLSQEDRESAIPQTEDKDFVPQGNSDTAEDSENTVDVDNTDATLSQDQEEMPKQEQTPSLSTSDDGQDESFLSFIHEALTTLGTSISTPEENEEEYVVDFNEDEHVNAFLNAPDVNSVGSPYDALWVCVNNTGKVNIEYIAALCGLGITETIKSLTYAIFQNPLTWDECLYKGFETASEYLSGNLYQKLVVAVRANEKYKGVFSKNIEALFKVMPRSVKIFDGDIKLGCPLIDKDMIEGFLKDVILKNEFEFNMPIVVLKNKTLNKWVVKGYRAYGNYNNPQYGTDYMTSIHIVERLLNFQPLDMYITVKKQTMTYKELDVERTAEVKDYADKINRAFREYINSRPEMLTRLKTRYYETFECFRPRLYDGSYLTLPNINPNIKLNSKQLDAVARIVQTPNTLLAHYVGAGKTYAMIAAGMELRRLGLSKSNWYVVPNHLVGQWEKEFRILYPDAKIEVVSPSAFTKAKRQAILERLSESDLDGVIIAYSCMEMIPVSKEEASKSYREFLEVLEEQKKLHENKALNYTIDRLITSYKKKLDKRNEAKEQLPFYFEQLKIDMLFVDEAHNYKNYLIETEIKNVRGINMSYSAKCLQMMEKTRYTQKHGRGVVFATATPITNSFTDIYVLQKYLQNELLVATELEEFDNWAGMYAEAEENMEIDVTGASYRAIKRFTRFRNLPELSNMVAAIADVNTDSSMAIHDMEVVTENIEVPRSAEVKRYIEALVKRADLIHRHRVFPNEDNMLKVTSDGRQASLDIRLVEPFRKFHPSCRVEQCAKKIVEIYKNGMSYRLTQLVFCDQSTPKKGFNVYDELKNRLIINGIPENEIAFIHDAKKPKDTELLYEKTRCGEIRVLIGSTSKLGIGANVQERLVAIHHLDIPWRPCDMIQREGRIKRPGNLNTKIFIYRYVMKGTFDAYSWQLLEAKQKLISQFLAGEFPAKSTDYIDETVLSYAEVKALALEDSRIKELMNAENEVQRLRMLKTQYLRQRERAEQMMMSLPMELDDYTSRVDGFDKDIILAKETVDKTFLMSILDEGGDSINYIDRQLAGDVLLDEIYRIGYSGFGGNEEQLTMDSEVKAEPSNTEDRLIALYRGFEVYLPYCPKETKHIYLKGAIKHRIEVGDSGMGLINRIDNCIDGFETNRKLWKDRATRCSQDIEYYSKVLRSTFDKESQLIMAEDNYMNLCEQFKEDDND